MIKLMKEQVRELLLKGDFQALQELYRRRRGVLRVLLSLTYDKTTLSTWRAIEAVGRLAQLMGPLEARQAAERLLWMMREESGGNPWSGPELLGEIIRARAGELQDLLPVLASFHEEPIFTEGVLWALGRVAQVAPGLVAPFEPLARMYLKQPFHVLGYQEYQELLVQFLERLSPRVVLQRLFATAPDELLIAPRWGRSRQEFLRDLQGLLQKKDTWQGRLFSPKAAASALP